MSVATPRTGEIPFALPSRGLLYTFAGVGATIFAYGRFRCRNPKFRDPLMRSINEEFDLDGWSVTHFLLFFWLARRFPNEFFAAQMIGIAWEAFEQIAGEQRPGILGGFGDCMHQAGRDEDGKQWWFGRWSDIVLNYVGWVAGGA